MINSNTHTTIPLAKLKHEYKFERYLNIRNFENRRALIKLRVGCHHLNDETKKWNGGLGTCQHCDNNENDYHFLFTCKKYEYFCVKTFEEICELDNQNMRDFKERCDLDRFFQNASLQSLNLLANFAKTSFEIRETKKQNCHYIIIL